MMYVVPWSTYVNKALNLYWPIYRNSRYIFVSPWSNNSLPSTFAFLLGHSFFHPRHNSQRRRISNPDFIHYIFCPIIIRQKEPVFPFFLSAKQGNYWYHFYNVFGMTRSLTGYRSQHSTTRLLRRTNSK